VTELQTRRVLAASCSFSALASSALKASSSGLVGFVAEGVEAGAADFEAGACSAMTKCGYEQNSGTINRVGAAGTCCEDGI
jgi:hypothetical protein